MKSRRIFVPISSLILFPAENIFQLSNFQLENGAGISSWGGPETGERVETSVTTRRLDDPPPRYATTVLPHPTLPPTPRTAPPDKTVN